MAQQRRSRGPTLTSLLRVFLTFAAVATIFLVGYSLTGVASTPRAGAPSGGAGGPGDIVAGGGGSLSGGGRAAVGNLRGAAESGEEKVVLKRDCAEPPCVPSFWVPTDISGVEHGDPRVTLCKLKFDQYWRQPSKTPMFRDLQTASKCGKGRSGRLGELYDDAVANSGGKGPLTPSGFVFHESRVGSTLVANMLASVPTNLVYSESGPPPVVLNHCRKCSGERRRELLVKLFGLMGNSQFHTHLFFKFQSITVPNIKVLLDAFPSTPWIFIYRDPVQTMMSHFKTGPGGPCLREQRTPRQATLDILGMTANEARKAKKESYCAAHLGMLTQAAVDADKASQIGLLVNYEALPGGVMGHVLPSVFHVDLAPVDLARMAKAGGVYSKARDKRSLQGTWASDSKAKEDASTPAVRDAAAAFLAPTFEAAKAATLAKTGGDDLLHFKEWQPPLAADR